MRMPITELVQYPGNARRGAVAVIRDSLAALGQYRPIVVNQGTITGRPYEVLAGNHTVQAAQQLGWEELEVHLVDVDAETAARIVLVDNRTNDLAGYDDTALLELLQTIPTLEGTGYTPLDVEELLRGEHYEAYSGDGLAAQYGGTPPFTVLDARRGAWVTRKREWLALGIRSELGRKTAQVGLATAARAKAALDRANGVNAVVGADGGGYGSGTSVFDPVLCELMYHWFSRAGHRVLDPWAGGSVRGIVASRLERGYLGVELRAEQVEANREQVGLAGQLVPEWVTGDSTDVLPTLEPGSFDMIFGCPPYYDLESYGDDPRDLGNMSTADFDAAIAAQLAAAAAALAADSFAVFVTGNVRDKHGHLRDLRGVIVQACAAAGLHFYNDGVLVTPLASLAMRSGLNFSRTRVLGRTHQEVLVFVKGDRKRAAKRCGTVDVGDALQDAELEGMVDDA